MGKFRKVLSHTFELIQIYQLLSLMGLPLAQCLPFSEILPPIFTHNTVLGKRPITKQMNWPSLSTFSLWNQDHDTQQATLLVFIIEEGHPLHS